MTSQTAFWSVQWTAPAGDFSLLASELKELEMKINYSFKHKAWLVMALTHRSYNGFPTDLKWPSYEKLEYLGDALLGFLISDYIICHHQLSEGELSKFRGALVNEKALGQLSDLFSLSQFVRLGKGQLHDGFAQSPKLKSDLYESVLGAIYNDGGLAQAVQFFKHTLEVYQGQYQKNFVDPIKLRHFDSKSQLQELTMKLYGEVPEYSSEQLGQNEFKVVVKVCGRELIQDQGHSKKKLERQLAKEILQKNLLNQPEEPYASH